MGPRGRPQTHVGEAQKMVLRTKNTRHMEKSLGSRGTVASLWIRKAQSMCGIAQDTGGLFLPSVNLRPYFLGGLLKPSQRAGQLFAGSLSLVWSEQLADFPPKDGQWEWSWSSWWIRHLDQNAKPKHKNQGCPLTLWGRGCLASEAYVFPHCADRQRQKTQEACATHMASK